MKSDHKKSSNNPYLLKKFCRFSPSYHNALVYVDIDQGIHKGKMKVALNEKGKKLRGFSFSTNISNFEAFLSVFKLTKNPLFLKSVPSHSQTNKKLL